MIPEKHLPYKAGDADDHQQSGDSQRDPFDQAFRILYHRFGRLCRSLVRLPRRHILQDDGRGAGGRRDSFGGGGYGRIHGGGRLGRTGWRGGFALEHLFDLMDALGRLVRGAAFPTEQETGVKLVTAILTTVGGHGCSS